MSFIFTILLIFILLLLLFIISYAIYCLLIAYASKNRRNFVRKGRYPIASYYNNIVVIIYVDSNDKSIATLLEALNKQNYPKENYKTYIILDNCSDEISNTLEMIGGANLFRIGNSFKLGKDESETQLLERLLTVKNINAYAFLGANRSIDENFLNSINLGLINHDVLVGTTLLKGEPKSLKEKIISAFNTYENNIINTSRSILGLSTLINSDCCVIKQNVIEKVQCIDFKNTNTEFKYTLMLSKLGYKVSYDPNITTSIDINDYQVRKPSFSYRIGLLKNSLPIFLKSNFNFCEFCLSAIQPSMFTLIVLMAFFAMLISTIEVRGFYSIFFNSKVFYGLLIAFLASGLYTVNNSKIDIKNVLYLLLYPVYSFTGLLRNLPIIKQICNFVENKNNPQETEKYSFPVTVAAGNKKMNCKIELSKEDGMIRGKFIFKNKKQSTDLHLRIYDAIKSISDMLAEREYKIVDPETKEIMEAGFFDLQICQNCKYFTTKCDGTINVIKGNCSLNSANRQEDETVMLWNSCQNYVPNKEKIVNLEQYRQNN